MKDKKINRMNGIKRRIDDAEFLWTKGRKESAFLLVMVAIASVSKLRYPKERDGDAFCKTLKDFHSVNLSFEYRGKVEPIEKIFYKWVRCNLIHEGDMPSDIEFQDDPNLGYMSVRAGGSPEYVLKLGSGWFFHMLESVKRSTEISAL